MWFFAAALSSVFAGATAILSKCGIKNVPSNLATALRTVVVLVFAWAIVFITGAYRTLGDISARSLTFLVLSGVATGASWLCYFKALSLGEVSKVAAVDKSSVVLSILFALTLFPEERNGWWIKLLCLCAIAAGMYLMTNIKHTNVNRKEQKTRATWLLFAFLSAVFAAFTSILSKIGIENVNSNAATAIRTGVVLIMAWLIVFFKNETKGFKEIQKKDVLFLVLSGISTGASWLFYYYAIQQGQVSVVVSIDKLSILITVIFSAVIFKEKLSKKSWFGLALLVTGTVLMAVLT